MAMTKEAAVKKAIKKILEVSGAYWSMPIGSGYGSAGTPDFLACHKGRFIGIEAKAGKGRTTALQEANLQRIRDAGGVAIVVDENNLKELERTLND